MIGTFPLTKPGRFTKNGHLPSIKGGITAFPPELFFDFPGNPFDLQTARDRLIIGYKAYASVPLVYRCMRIRADKLSEPPMRLQKETKDGLEWVENNPLEDLFDQPNPDMS
jgi:hypothetical protein